MVTGVSTIEIIGYEIIDLRFPTSEGLHGSDAKHTNPDYSAPYLILKTSDPNLTGIGLSFTIGDGNQLVVDAVKILMKQVVGRNLSDITENMGSFWSEIVYRNSQLCWVGQDSGVKALATAAVINAVWDLWAKHEKKPLWKLVSDMSPEELLRCIDLTYLSDEIDAEKAFKLLRAPRKFDTERLMQLKARGYPAYSTSAGWLGYTDDEVREKCADLLKEGWRHIKLKVGRDFSENIRRISLVRSIVGPDVKIMIDANQVLSVEESRRLILELKEKNLDIYFFEEPTHPMDVQGHKKIKDYAASIGSNIKIATGEQCPNSVVFKQLISLKALDFCQFDPCRLMGINEALAVMLMAAINNIPVYPHAGGVGLCNYVQHLSVIYRLVFGKHDGITEYVSHLQEHFVDPVKVSSGHYQLPESYGCSVEIKPEILEVYRYPDGIYWREKLLSAPLSSFVAASATALSDKVIAAASAAASLD